MFNHAEHDGPERGHHAAAAEDRLPDHRGAPRHARPRPGLAAARRSDRPGLAALVRRRRAPARAPLPAPGSAASGSSPTAASCSRSTRSRRAASSRCSRAATSRASRSACSTPTSTHAHEERLRELAREVLGDVAVSISSETSPLAKEYARASTTVVDVFMKLIFTDYAEQLDRDLRGARLRRRAQLRRLRRHAAPLGGGARAAVPHRLRRPCGGHGLEHAARRGDRRRQPPLLRRRRHLDRRLARASTGGRSSTNTFELEHDLHHQRALDRGLERRRRAAAASSRSRRPATSSSGLAAPAPTPGPACYGRGGEAPTLTDACLLMGILDPDGFAGGELRLDPDAGAPGLRVARHAAAASTSAIAFALPDRGGEHRRRGAERRHPPRRRPARLHARRLRRRRADAAAGGARAAARAAGRRPAAPGALLRARPAQHRPRLLRQPQRLRGAGPGGGGRRSRAVFEEMEQRLRAKVGGGDERRRRSGAASTAGCSARAGRRRSSRCPDGPITEETIPELVERFHAEYERRYGNRFPYVPVQGVSYRVELVVPAEKVEYVARSAASRGRRRAGPHVELRHLADDVAEGRRVRARDAPCRVPACRRAGGHSRGALDDARLPGPGRRGRPLRRDRDRGRHAA